MAQRFQRNLSADGIQIFKVFLVGWVECNETQQILNIQAKMIGFTSSI